MADSLAQEQRHSNRTKLIVTTVILGITVASVQISADEFDTFEALYGDEESVSIATGSAKSIHLAPSVATVITAAEIKTMGASNLDEVLETVPGLHVYLLQRWSSGYSIRGVHTTTNPQVLLLMDGHPITDSFSGGRPPKYLLPLHSISRIEIIRGPGSAIYGADAFAGVINIITKSSDDIDSTEAGLTLGSFDTQGIWLQSSATIAGWESSIVLDYTQSDGDAAREVPNDLQNNLDAFFSTDASLAPGAANTRYEVFNSQIHLKKNNWSLKHNYWRQEDSGIGIGIAEALDPTGSQDTSYQLFEVDYKNTTLTNSWQVSASLSYYTMKQQSRYTIFPPGAVLPIGSDGNLDFTSANFVQFPDGYIGNPGGRDTRVAGDIAFIFTGFDRQRIRLASGLKTLEFDAHETKNFGPGVIDGTQPLVDGTLTDVTGTPFIFLPDSNRDNYFVSLQDEVKILNDWELTAGLRYDHYSDFGSTLNLRGALVWQTTYNLTTKLLYGEAFRAPAFSELFAINNPVVLGNPSLEPETIDTWELSFDYRPTYDVTLKLNVFSYQIEDLIDFIPDSGAATRTAQNALKQDGRGFEFEFDWALSDTVDLSGSFSRQRSEYPENGADVADAPQSLAYLNLNWQVLPQWRLSLQGHHVADRPRAAGDMRSDIDDYNLVNVALSGDKIFKRWRAKVSVLNLFDEEAYEPGSAAVPVDFRLQTRSILLDLECRLTE